MPENIDEEFFEAMRSIGGQRPAEIDPKAGDTLNADVVFRHENVIMEIKSLMEDPSRRDGYIEKVSAIYDSWKGRPGVPIFWGQRRLNSADLPHEMGREFVRTLGGPIRGAVRKANRQIRRTKEVLGMPGAHGVLLLCNTGASSLSPHVILYELHHALGAEHASINSAIYLTHGVPAAMPNVPEPVEVFGFANRAGCEPLRKEFSDRIQDAWFRHQSRKKPVKVYHGTDPSVLFDASNVRKAVD